MTAFEDACAELSIPLFVLPPQKSTYNGGVERSNRTFREKVYNRPDLLEDSIRRMQGELNKAILKYNTFSPHTALNGINLCSIF